MKTVYLSVRLKNYENALALVGAPLAETPENADVLLLPGGGDMHPRFYGQALDGSKDLDEARDARELTLIDNFLCAGKPVIVPGDGLTLWTLTHSDDFAVAFVGLMGNVHALGEVFHITGDESLTWNQVYSSIGAALGVEPHLVHIASETLGALCQSYVGSLLGDKSNTVLFDNAKIKRAVPEFVAAKRFDQGVREAVAYIYSHPECQRPDPAFDAWCDQVIEGYERLTAALPKFEM